MSGIQFRITRHVKRQREKKQLTETDLKIIQIFKLPDIDFKITVINVFKKIESR